MAAPSNSVLGEELLQAATRGETILSEDWPRVLDTILERLEDTLRNVFPIPRIPEPDPPPPPLFTLSSSTRPDDELPASQASAATDKENAPPRAPTATPTPRPPVPAFPATSQDATQPTQTDADMQDSQSPSPTIPIQLLDLYEYIRSTLRSGFAKDPPHTLQRLAELILYPKMHYRFLPSYLRALDRVVCVSSPAKIFPLPAVALPTQGLLNGTTAPALAPAKESLGSDESLGGALLTPIPWLKADRGTFGDSNSDSTSPTQSQSSSQGGNELKSEDTEMVDGPNGVGRVETVSVVNGVMVKTSGSPTKTSSTTVPEAEGSDTQASSKQNVGDSLREAGAVTQGELLRLEQEAGVVPVSVASRSPSRNKNAASAGSAGVQSKSYGPGEGSQTESKDTDDDLGGEEEEKPHARGPEAITDEDIGPQNAASPPGVLDLEKAVGRSLTQAIDGDVDAMQTEESSGKSKETEQDMAESKSDSVQTIGEPGRSEGNPEDGAAVD